jgi:DNA-binding CsgD family transcriptional regulator
MDFLIWLLLPLLLLVALADLATMSPDRRARLLRRAGMTQQQLADRLGVSRYKVRQYLAA